MAVTRRNGRKQSFKESHETDENTEDTEDQNFLQLAEDDEDLEELRNMYHPEQVFTVRACGGKHIWFEEWKDVLTNKRVSTLSRRDVYFSIFHGIEFAV